MAKRPHRRTGGAVGRPPKPLTDDPDLQVIGDALALRLAHGYSKRVAIDLAIAIHESQPAEPTNRPRARRPANWLPGGLILQRPGARFDHRNDALRQKMKRLPRKVLRELQITALLRALKG
jgi:hypothetical protein